jgi:subtilisin family serine protease
MASKNSIYNLLLALIMAFSLMVPASGSVLANPNKPPRLHPDFLQMVQDNPDATFKVIIQKDARNKDLRNMELEGEVLRGRGQVKKQLDMIVSFSAEMTGKEVTKLAKNPKVRWISPDAPVVSTAIMPGTYTFRDEFNLGSFSGSNGLKNWSSDPWIEIGETDGVTTGKIQVNNSHCVADNCLQLKGASKVSWGVYRQVNLAGAASATLSFQYWRVIGLTITTASIQVQVSADGGNTWTLLDSLLFTTSDTGFQSAQYNLSPYANANTQIRFIGNGYNNSELHIDNLEIEYSNPSPYRAIVGADNLTLDGQGVTVAVVDSGVSDHMDLHQNATSPSEALNSNSRVIQNLVFGNLTSPSDEYVHGSHVAGIIGGNGVASNGKYKGIAPGVNLINIRVSNNQGLTYTSDLLAGLQWIFTNKDVYNIRVVNLSINSTMPESYLQSPLDAAVEILWFNGIVVVVAAGNNGTADGPSTVYPPANDPFVITVGAQEDLGTVSMSDDSVAAFSAYSTTADGFAKPDLIAPGRNLISLLASTNATGYTGHIKHRVDASYFRMSGTSMAAPVVTGVIALLLQDEPGLNPDQVKYRLMATANQSWTGYNLAKAGAGTVDAYAAVSGTTTNSANQGIMPSQLLTTGANGIALNSVGWNSVGWNSVGWNSVGWNSVGWNSVGWNSVGWNSVGWNSSTWDEDDIEQ